MTDVLFLAHRLPFPPDKGDKIRSYHLLRHLADRYAVHLGCFIDDPNDEQYVSEDEIERIVAREFDASIQATDEEVELFSRLAPESAAKVHAVPNGVSTDYFDPSVNLENPYPDGVKAVFFTDMMDYWANVDAVTWFAKEVFPAILASDPDAEFWIVGGSPTGEVENLERLESVRVTGRVPDVRPYLKYSTCAVAPLRIARGIQNKVLEAMAMDRPIVFTSQAATGIGNMGSIPPLVISDDAPGIAVDTLRILQQGRDSTSDKLVRDYAVEKHCWGQALDKFGRVHTGNAG
jgi:sugar transferase (PEP-CTERM/EpsH1 system associated)